MEDFVHGKFSGLRNTVRNHRFGLDDLEVAINVDIDDSQALSRRHGFGALVVSGAYKSLWSEGDMALAVKSQTQLTRIMPDWSEVALRTGLAPGLDMSYTLANSRVYYANGLNKGVIDNGASRTWGIEIPGIPTAAATGGLLVAGKYQFAVTYLRADRQESGTPTAGVIELTVDGGVRLTGISVSTDPSVTHKAVYFSKRDGEVLYRAGIIDADDTTFDYQLESSMQVPLQTQHLRPPPAGHIVDNLNGSRTMVADGSTLYCSEPYALELFDLRKNYQMPGRITMVAALETGVFVSTANGTVWLDGVVPERWAMRKLKDYGAIPGALYFCNRDAVLDGQGQKRVVVFGTSKGVCVGEDGGGITNLNETRYQYPVQDRGALIVRDHRGMSQCIAVFQGTERAANTAS